jgi:integrase
VHWNTFLDFANPELLFQELLGHNDISTTIVYTRVLNKPGLGITSPIDDEQNH